MLKSLMKALTTTYDGPAIETETTKELILDTPIKRAKISLHNGKITLRQWDRQEVKAYVQVRATGEYAERAGEEKNTDQFWSLHTTGNTVVFEQLPQLKFFKEGSLSIQLELFIPQQVNAELHLHNGTLDIAEFQGDLEARTHNGALNAEKITGNLDVQTHNGDIDIDTLDGNLSMEVHNGSLRASGVTGRIKGQTHNGKIILDNAGQQGLLLETHNGQIRVNTQAAITSEWNLTTHAGDIEVSIPQATSAVLTAKTSNGRISGPALNQAAQYQAKKMVAQLGGGNNPMVIESHRGDITVQFAD